MLNDNITKSQHLAIPRLSLLLVLPYNILAKKGPGPNNAVLQPNPSIPEHL